MAKNSIQTAIASGHKKGTLVKTKSFLIAAVMKIMPRGMEFTAHDLYERVVTVHPTTAFGNSVSGTLHKQIAAGAVADTGKTVRTSRSLKPVKVYRMVDPTKLKASEDWFDTKARTTEKHDVKAPAESQAKIIISKKNNLANRLLAIATEIESFTQPKQKTALLKDFTTKQLMAEVKRRMK